jgi:hypothetical protein
VQASASLTTSEDDGLTVTNSEVGLFRMDEKQYGNKFHDHLLEQYKLYVEMADRVSARRALANTFFLTANAALLSLLTLYNNRGFPGYSALGLVVLTAVTCGLVVFSASWWAIIRAYDQLNAGKFQIIHELEAKLPAALYDKEWQVLGRGKDPKKYLPFTSIERIVPLAFIVLYVILLAARVLANC